VASSVVRGQVAEPQYSEASPKFARSVVETDKIPARCVLFFDHTAAISGGEIALSNLLHHLDPRKVRAIVVLGEDGPLVDGIRPAADVHLLLLGSSIAKQKKDLLGVRSLFRVKDVFYLVKYVFRLMRFMHANKVEIIHTNSLKADIIGGVAGLLSMRRVVWHVRDRIEDDYLPGAVVRVFRFLCRIIPHYVIANSAASSARRTC